MDKPDGKTFFEPHELPFLEAMAGKPSDNVDAVLRPPTQPGHVSFVNITTLRDAVTRFNDRCHRLFRLSLSVGCTEFDPRAAGQPGVTALT